MCFILYFLTVNEAKLLFIYLRPTCISSSMTYLSHILSIFSYGVIIIFFLSILFRRFVYHTYCKYFPQPHSLEVTTINSFEF